MRWCGEGAHGVHRFLPRGVVVESTVHQTVQTDDFPAPSQGDELHRVGVSWLEANRCSCGDIQTIAISLKPIEF